MPGLGVIDENLVVIKIKLNLTSIDTALSDVVSLLGNGTLNTVAGGDAQTLIDHRKRNFSPLVRQRCYARSWCYRRKLGCY